MATGMRLGEILGLRWRDVDLEAELVRVCKAVEWTGRQYRLTDPKTPRGRRTIHLAPSAAEALRRVRKSQAERRLAAGEGWSDEDFVFDAGDGRPMRTDVVSSAFRALVKDAHLPRVRFHDLRHGFATQLLASGVHPKVVSEALGHASVSLTLDVYSHVLPSMGAQTARAIEAALGTVISAP
jgi:integrase